MRPSSGCCTRCARPTTCSSATELAALAAASPALRLDFVYTRRAPDGLADRAGPRHAGPAGCRDAARGIPLRCVYVCGPTPFVEAVAAWLIDAGHEPGDVRTERFGGS